MPYVKIKRIRGFWRFFMLKLLKKFKYSYFFWILFYIFIFTLLFRHSLSYLDPDLGWHLRVGQEITINEAVPHENLYNYTYTGNWVDHEWLSNYLLYQAYSNYGYLFLAFLFSIIIVTILILLNIKVKKKYPNSDFFIIFFEFFGLIAALPHLGVRIQEIGLLFILILLLIIDNFNRNKNWRVLLILPFGFYFWSCLHASFLIGLFLMGAWLVIKLFENSLVHYRKIYWLDLVNNICGKELSIFLLFLFLSFIATLFTPYRLELYSFLSGYRDSFYQLHIVEWLPQYSIPLKYWQFIYLSVLAAIIILNFVYVLVFRKGKINLWTNFLALFFLCLSIKSRRHFPLMFICTFTFIFDFIYLEVKESKKTNFFKFNQGILGLVVKLSLLAALVLSISLQLLSTSFINKPFSSFCGEFPCEAADFLNQNDKVYGNLNLFNYYDWGGYLNWVSPERKLFIDGRLPQVEYAGQTFLEEYYEFFKKTTNLSEKLADYNIQLVLLPAKDKETEFKKWERLIFKISENPLKYQNYLRDSLNKSSDWSKIYEDKVSVIYLKNN